MSRSEPRSEPIGPARIVFVRFVTPVSYEGRKLLSEVTAGETFIEGPTLEVRGGWLVIAGETWVPMTNIGYMRCAK